MHERSGHGDPVGTSFLGGGNPLINREHPGRDRWSGLAHARPASAYYVNTESYTAAAICYRFDKVLEM